MPQKGHFKDPKGYRWAFGIAAVDTDNIQQLSVLPEVSEDPSVAGLLQVKEQQVPIATKAVHRRQYRTNRDSLLPIHKLIRQLESQGVISRTHSPFNSPIWPVRKASGEWRLTVDYRGLNEVTPPLSAAVPHTSQLQDDPDSKAAKRYATTDIAHAFFSIPLAAVCFHPEGRSVHLGPFAPGLETQPNRLPRVDPSGTGTRTAVLPSTCSTLTTLLCGAIQQRTCSSKESKYSKCFCMLVLLFSEAEQSERTCTGNSVPRSKTAR